MKKRGFTLLEVIIYIALFGLLMGAAALATFNILEGGERNHKLVSIQEEGTFLVRKLNWELTNAESASAPNEKTLRIEPGNIVVQSENDTLTVSRNGGSEIELGSEAHRIEDVEFSVTGGGTPTVRVSFAVDGKPFSFAKELRQ